MFCDKLTKGFTAVCNGGVKFETASEPFSASWRLRNPDSSSDPDSSRSNGCYLPEMLARLPKNRGIFFLSPEEEERLTAHYLGRW